MTEDDYNVRCRRSLRRITWVRHLAWKCQNAVTTVENIFVQREIRYLKKLEKAQRETEEAR